MNDIQDPRWIEVKASRINLAVTVIGLLLVMVAVCAIDLRAYLPVWLLGLLFLAMLAALLWDLRLILLKGPESVVAFYLFERDLADEHGAAANAAPALGIRIRLAGESPAGISVFEGVVLKGGFVTPWFSTIPFRLPGDAAWRRGWPRLIPLWADSLDRDRFRDVRVRLKWT
jgi:hypothetical protein